MLLRRFRVAMLLACTLAFATAALHAAYPERPVRVVTTEPGTTADFIGRVLAHRLTGTLGQQVIIDNRGIVGPEIVAKAQPDGYTLLLYTNPLWLMPLFRDGVHWSALRDFAPIAVIVRTPNIVVVHPSLPVNSMKEFIAYARAKPGELNYGSSSTGAANHVAVELFKAMAGVQIVRINYKGGGAAINALIAGQIQLMFATAGSVAPHIKSGRLRALAVTTAEPSALVPGLPTVAADVVPGYESASYSVLFAPAKVPAAIIARLNREIVALLKSNDIREQFFNVGVEAVGSSPAEAAAMIASEINNVGRVVKEAQLHE
ncbi:MAG TPA: tripartite tricarboxylate transporter substrate binding protein [Burkholderiales bacterium]|nr:tripartite tricarboxylate transporter substrate binding protein [Burkholderiales bacterium]